MFRDLTLDIRETNIKLALAVDQAVTLRRERRVLRIQGPSLRKHLALLIKQAISIRLQARLNILRQARKPRV